MESVRPWVVGLGWCLGLAAAVALVGGSTQQGLERRSGGLGELAGAGQVWLALVVGMAITWVMVARRPGDVAWAALSGLLVWPLAAVGVWLLRGFWSYDAVAVYVSLVLAVLMSLAGGLGAAVKARRIAT